MSKLTRMIRHARRRKTAAAELPSSVAALQSAAEAGRAELSALRAENAARQSALERELYNIKQTVNLAAAARPAGKKAKTVFLVHHIEAWDSLADIYQLMLAAEDFAPLVISIPRRFPGERDFGFEDIIHQKLTEQGIAHLRFNMADSFEGLDILKALAPDIIFRQSQWDNDIPPGYAARELRFARLCYVPYGVTCMVNTGELEGERDPAADSDLHRFAWKVFYATRYQEKLSLCSSQNLEIVGHPKVRRLQRLGAEKPFWPIKQAGARGFRIIWSPHHSVGCAWLRFGLFPAVYREMLDWVKTDSGIEMTLSCHPATLSKMAEEGGGALPREELEDFLRQWDALPNAARFSGGGYAGLMQASDCLISDGLSFLAEYQFFNKPVIFLERAGHLPLSPAGEQIIEGTHPVASVAEAKKLAHDFAAGCVDIKAQVQRRNTAWLAGEKLASGTAAERIIHSVRRGLRG